MRGMTRKRILVTGGAGFLGAHLCQRLLEEGHEVLCVDNFFTGSKDNVLELLDNPHFELMRHDVTFPLYIEVDEIYNLACPASPIHYQYDPVQTTKTSVHGAINMLGLAKRVKAKIFQASTSEVYGDPQIHPQPEHYWGHVNPIGIRSCYDEGKRCAETLFFDYHRQHKLRIKVARIFNSLTGDQKVIYFKKNVLFHETFAECYNRISHDISGVEVPCFDPQGRMVLRPISAIWRHHVTKRGFIIKTTWGRSVKITEDHSLFTRDDNGQPRAVFGHELNLGDEIAVPAQLPFREKRLEPFSILEKLAAIGLPVNVVSEYISEQCSCYEKQMRAWLSKQGVHSRQHFSYVNRYRKGGCVPLPLWQEMEIPDEVEYRIAPPFSSKLIKDRVEDIESLLWFLGFYLAEGCLIYNEKQDYQLLFSSNEKYLRKLINVIYSLFGIDTEIRWSGATRAPTVHLRSKVVVELITKVFGFGTALSTRKTIPTWILQLPKSQLVHFLQGFWEGDGNHDAKTTGKMLIFNSSSPELIEQLVLLLGRFGIIGSVSKFKTRPHKSSEKWFTAYRITVQGLNEYDILRLQEVTQTLQVKTTADLAWGRVVSIEPFEINDYVYDFSVPEYENFIGGTYGICCHNTYGPKMHPADGRVVSNFIIQALNNEPITLYGDGSQTRSFCYVDDLIEAFVRLMNSPDEITGPINTGNPGEFTIRELAEKIIDLTGSRSPLEYRPLPADDPTQRQPDITLAREKLGWEPKISLEEGLKRTIPYFEGMLRGFGS